MKNPFRRFLALSAIALSCADESPPDGPIQVDGSLLEARSPLWLENRTQNEGWSRAILLFSDQDLDCSDLPKSAPGLRALWKNPPIQGEGSGLLLWLQWTDLDETIDSWKGRFLFGEAPVGDRTQRRAVQVPFENGIPYLNRPGRHGSVEILSLSESVVEGQIKSDTVQGSFSARSCHLTTK